MHREIKKIYPYFNVCVFVFTIWLAPAMQDLHLVQSDILDGICSAMSRHVGKQMAKYNTCHTVLSTILWIPELVHLSCIMTWCKGVACGDNSRWRTFHRQALTVAVAP